jgi:hypothetical protein
MRNDSAAYELIAMGNTGAADINVTLWLANGTLPNSVPGSFESYPLVTYADKENPFAWSAVVNNGENLIAVAAPPGSWYGEKWDQMQCSVEFQPSLFAVSANLTSKAITVIQKPLLQGQSIENIEPSGNLTANVMLSLDRLSRMSNNFDQSVLGGPISWNVVNVNNSNPGLTEEEADILGLEDSITAILDDLLFAFGAAELVLAQATTPTPFSGSYDSIKVGSDKYIFATLGINVAVLIFLAAEAARAMFWNGLTKFNYTDVKRVIVASSAGGMSIASAGSMQSPQQSPRVDEENGRNREKYDMGEAKVKLMDLDTGVELHLQNRTSSVPGQDNQDQSDSSLIELLEQR